MTKKSKPLNERQLVNLFIKALKKNSPGIYVHVDRDSGNMRHTASGWDFLAIWEGKTVFCECKIAKGKLTDWQKLTRVEIQKAKGKYNVLFLEQSLDKKSIFILKNDNTWNYSISSNNVNGDWLVS